MTSTEFFEHVEDLKNLREWMNTNQENIADAKDDLDNAVTNIESEQDELRGYVSDMETTIEQIVEDYNELQRDYEEIKAEKEELESQLNDVKEKCGNVEDTENKENRTKEMMEYLLRVHGIPYVMMALGEVFYKGFDTYTEANVKKSLEIIEAGREYNNTPHECEDGKVYVPVITTDAQIQIVKISESISKLSPWDVIAWMKANLPLAQDNFYENKGDEE